MIIMEATVEIFTLPNPKIITKQSSNRESLVSWLVKMSDNPLPIIGYLNDGTFAIATGSGQYDKE